MQMAFALILLLCKLMQAIDGEETCDPSGYKYFFQSSLREARNIPLKFSEPVPKWIKGTLIRNGAGQFEMGRRQFGHVFDAYAKLHSFEFHGNGRVSFSAKFLRTEYYNRSREMNNIAPYLQFHSTNPPYSILDIMDAFKNKMDNTNVNVYRIYNKYNKKYEYITLNDIWKVYQIDAYNLDTISPIVPKTGMDKYLYISEFSSAHPLKEYGRDSYITFLTSFSRFPLLEKSKMTLFRMNSAAERREIVSWKIDEVRYIHSFGVTKHYAVLLAPPIFISSFKVMENGNVFDGMKWDSKAPLLIYLVNIDSAEVRVLKHDTLFFLHHINAYEDNNTIIADICTFDNSSSLKLFEMDNVLNPNILDNIQYNSHLVRVTIDLETFVVRQKNLDTSAKLPQAHRMDLPTINENFRHSKYCFAYGIAPKFDNVHFSTYAIVKKDLCRSTGDKSWANCNHYPSEAWFVQSPGAIREDDGILLSHVFDGDLRMTYLVMINATTMETISKAKVPLNIPMSFHGRFFPN